MTVPGLKDCSTVLNDGIPWLSGIHRHSNTSDWHHSLNWQIIQSVPIQGRVSEDLRKSVIHQRKSWIQYFAYCIPNKKSLNTCICLRLKDPKEGIHTVHTVHMQIWDPYLFALHLFWFVDPDQVRIRFNLHFAFCEVFDGSGTNPVSFSSFGKNSLDG